jgi:hypothetical protein
MLALRFALIVNIAHAAADRCSGNSAVAGCLLSNQLPVGPPWTPTPMFLTGSNHGLALLPRNLGSPGNTTNTNSTPSDPSPANPNPGLSFFHSGSPLIVGFLAVAFFLASVLAVVGWRRATVASWTQAGARARAAREARERAAREREKKVGERPVMWEVGVVNAGAGEKEKGTGRLPEPSWEDVMVSCSIR